ncbi:MAG: hypothetical protein M1833_000979 [Piccolia ochrophora]|nr:MAG: hypothetical protein M1833_000979 [Piccolia ochrophora]
MARHIFIYLAAFALQLVFGVCAIPTVSLLPRGEDAQRAWQERAIVPSTGASIRRRMINANYGSSDRTPAGTARQMFILVECDDDWRRKRLPVKCKVMLQIAGAPGQNPTIYGTAISPPDASGRRSAFMVVHDLGPNIRGNVFQQRTPAAGVRYYVYPIRDTTSMLPTQIFNPTNPTFYSPLLTSVYATGAPFTVGPGRTLFHDTAIMSYLASQIRDHPRDGSPAFDETTQRTLRQIDRHAATSLPTLSASFDKVYYVYADGDSLETLRVLNYLCVNMDTSTRMASVSSTWSTADPNPPAAELAMAMRTIRFDDSAYGQ